METVQWKVEGMDCANCAITINRYLEKQGLKNVKVNFANGDVLFDLNGTVTPVNVKRPFLSTPLQRFLFCLPFTAILMLHMIPGVHIHWLLNPVVQLALS